MILRLHYCALHKLHGKQLPERSSLLIFPCGLSLVFYHPLFFFPTATTATLWMNLYRTEEKQRNVFCSLETKSNALVCELELMAHWKAESITGERLQLSLCIICVTACPFFWSYIEMWRARLTFPSVWQTVQRNTFRCLFNFSYFPFLFFQAYVMWHFCCL